MGTIEEKAAFFDDLNRHHLALAEAAFKIDYAIREIHDFQKWLLERRNEALAEYIAAKDEEKANA